MRVFDACRKSHSFQGSHIALPHSVGIARALGITLGINFAVDVLRHYDIAAVYEQYREGRKGYYRALVNEHPLQRKFLKAWLRRADSFPELTGAAKQCPPA